VPIADRLFFKDLPGEGRQEKKNFFAGRMILKNTLIKDFFGFIEVTELPKVLRESLFTPRKILTNLLR